jgi:hypothetical protein
LVVRGVAGRDALWQHGATRRTRARLEVRAGRTLDLSRHERGPESRCGRRDDLGLGCRAGAEPVVDVIGGHAAAGRDAEREQRE